MKRVLFVMFVLVLMGSFAFAQNVVDLQQSVGPSTATISQTGSGSTVLIEQIGVSAATSGFVNKVLSEQKQSINSLIDVYQNAGTYNYADLFQHTKNHSEIRVNQQAGTYNWAEIRQKYTVGSMFLYGASDGAGDVTINSGTPATQFSATGSNYLKVHQNKEYTIGLHQEADGDNFADIDQKNLYAHSVLAVYQVSSGGANTLYAEQAKQDNAKVKQNAAGNNYADVSQSSYTGATGYHDLVGADSDGTINTTKAAHQNSTGSYNQLWTVQSGGYSEIGLYQSAVGYNFANIGQFNGNNSLGIYQTNTSGYNEVTATQNGNMTATVIQSTTSGNGSIIVNQGP